MCIRRGPLTAILRNEKRDKVISERVYINAGYAEDNGNRNVIDILNQWGSGNRHRVDFINMSKVAPGNVSNDPGCRPCNLKREFNQQVGASFAAIFIVGDKTVSRKAGSNCSRVNSEQTDCSCTPYKQSSRDFKTCKVTHIGSAKADNGVGNINVFPHLQHEFGQVRKRKKSIVTVYNSLHKKSS